MPACGVIVTSRGTEACHSKMSDPTICCPMAERRQAGHDLRRLVPRGLHATWQPPSDRRDPLEMLIETSRHRISSLLPIRYGRMQPSAFAFLRGSAAVMAADLADHADQRHLGAVLRRLPSGEFRHLCGAGRHPDLRRHRFRRDAAGTVRMGPEAPRHQRRGRCARPTDAGACLPRSRPRRGHGVSPAHGEADAARSRNVPGDRASM